MPDLKSELSKVLQAWDEPAPQPQPPETTMTTSASRTAFRETNGVTRATFNYVKDNPGQTRMQVINGLEAKGFKPSSTSSILAQMTNQSLLRTVNGSYFTAAPEYRPLKSPQVYKRSLLPPSAKQKRAKAAPPKEPVIEIVTPPAQPIKEAKASKPWSPDDVIEGLNVKQAMAVHDALRELLRM